VICCPELFDMNFDKNADVDFSYVVYNIRETNKTLVKGSSFGEYHQTCFVINAMPLASANGIFIFFRITFYQKF
jgi:hypothetical protein